MAQFGSAPHWGCGGRRFKSCQSDKVEPVIDFQSLTFVVSPFQGVFHATHLKMVLGSGVSHPAGYWGASQDLSELRFDLARALQPIAFPDND